MDTFIRPTVRLDGDDLYIGIEGNPGAQIAVHVPGMTGVSYSTHVIVGVYPTLESCRVILSMRGVPADGCPTFDFGNDFLGAADFRDRIVELMGWTK